MASEPQDATELSTELAKPAEVIPVASPVAPPRVPEALPSFQSIVQAVTASGGNMSAESVAVLTDVYLKMTEANAKQEYILAFHKFQDECPSVPRTKKRTNTSKKGAGGFVTHYADIQTIMQTVKPFLAKHGFSVAFDNVELTAKTLSECCRCSHIAGHSETATTPMPLDSPSPAMSAQDCYDAASSRAQRRALSKVLGIQTEEYSPGAAAEPEKPSAKLTGEQKARITALVQEIGQDWGSLLTFMGVKDLADATTEKYDEVVQGLETRRANMRKGGT